MNTTLYDTQKVRADLQSDLQKAQSAYTDKPTLEALQLIRWITEKLAYVGSPEYYRRKAMQ